MSSQLRYAPSIPAYEPGFVLSPNSMARSVYRRHFQHRALRRSTPPTAPVGQPHAPQTVSALPRVTTSGTAQRSHSVFAPTAARSASPSAPRRHRSHHGTAGTPPSVSIRIAFHVRSLVLMRGSGITLCHARKNLSSLTIKTKMIAPLLHHATFLRPVLDPPPLQQRRPALRPPALCYLSLAVRAARTPRASRSLCHL
jgi:hypothetical protein